MIKNKMSTILKHHSIYVIGHKQIPIKKRIKYIGVVKFMGMKRSHL